jgi:uncharacterized protein (TIGR03083 family)
VDDDYWVAVAGMRVEIADLLEQLTEAEWEHESLCAGWRVRDVAGHVSLVPTITTWELVRAARRGGFNPNRINTVLAKRYGQLPPEAIVARIREHAQDRTTAKALDTKDSLFDVIVHGQDIARPLGRRVHVRPEHASRGLDRVWEMGWPFKARQRYADVRLQATDTNWARGESGRLVEGPALELLLLLTGRDRAAALGSAG